MHPHYRIIKHIKSSAGCQGIRTGRHQQFQFKGVSIRVLKFSPESVIGAHAQEKEIRCHRCDRIVIDYPVPPISYRMPCFFDITIGNEIGISLIRNDGRSVSAFCFHIIYAWYYPLKSPLLTLSDLLWWSSCGCFIIVETFQYVFSRSADGLGINDELCVRRYCLQEPY